MVYLLDTNTVSAIQKHDPIVQRRAAGHSPLTLFISVITVEEQMTGWYTALRQAKDETRTILVWKRLTDTVRFYRTATIVDYDAACIAKFRELVALKLNVKHEDLRIAATALVLGATVVTRNRVDFERIPGVVIEDWHTPDL